MAHLVFKVFWSNICPRSGNISNFTFQYLSIVTMNMFGKAIDATEIILETMFDVLDKTKTEFLCWRLLTRIFDFYQVDLVECEVRSNKVFG